MDSMDRKESTVGEITAIVEQTAGQCRRDVQSFVANRIRRGSRGIARPLTSADLAAVRAAAAELRGRIGTLLSFA